MRVVPPIGDTWREAAAIGGGASGSLAVFFVAAATTPVDAVLVDALVLGTIVVITAASRRLAGLGQSACVAVMGAFSFDFFHVEPIRVLHLGTLLILLAWMLAVVALTAVRQPAGSGSSLGRSNR